ncbi:MAG: hypothetical protein AAGF83_08630 [Cyanobacteria bacterium P01_G01_bin.67]
MKELTIQFPGYMERCIGFTVPENGQFYVVSFNTLVYYQLDNGIVTEIEQTWDLRGKECIILLEEKEIPFIGLWGGSSIHKREGLGKLQLENSVVSLTKENEELCRWKFENFSDDWEQITFDRYRDAFLFGTPYDFDYRYVYIP